jgi:Protein of unknown function (DUF3300)
MSGGRRGWTIFLTILLSSCLTGFLQAQAPPREPPQAPAQSAPQQLAPEELNKLLAPIALYPDALIALILPASTVPSDLVLAARYIASNGDPAQVANQPWDDSVKSLARYPDVLKWMDQNLEWTTAVGEAFLDQPADVMNSIQALRAEAIAAGNLTDSPQQHVVQEKTCIRIVPAEPDVIYVPQYDPEAVYAQPYSQNVGPLLTFGAGFAVGSWLNYDCDWGRRSIYVGHWRPGWTHDRNWDRGGEGQNWNRGDRNWDRWDQGRNNNSVNVVNINSDTARQWQPSANSQRRQAQHQRSNPANARISSVNAPDANLQPGGPSTPGLTRGADPRANHIPKPSRPDFTSQGNERNRRELQDSNGSPKTSNESPPSPDVAPNTSAVTNAMPRARDKNHKVPAPSTAPNVPGQQGKQLNSGAQESAPRNVSKREQSSHQSNGGTSNQPTAAPSIMQPGAPTEKQQKHVDHSESPSQQSDNSPQPSTKQDKPLQPPPAVAHQGQQPSHESPPLPDVAPNTSGVTNLTSEAPGKTHKKPAPSTAPNVPGQQGKSLNSGAQESAPRNVSKREESSHQSNAGTSNQPTAAPSIMQPSAPTEKQQKHVDHAESPSQQSDNSLQPSTKQDKPLQPPPAVAHQDEHSERSQASPNQNKASQPSNASTDEGKGGRDKKKDKGGGEKKSDEKKGEGDN